MRFMVKVLLPPLVLVSAFLALMLRWTLNLSAFILALPMMYIFGCGLYTLYCREWTQFLILLAAEFGCFLRLFPAHHCRNGYCGSRGMVQRLDCRTVMGKVSAYCPYSRIDFISFAIYNRKTY